MYEDRISEGQGGRGGVRRPGANRCRVTFERACRSAPVASSTFHSRTANQLATLRRTQDVRVARAHGPMAEGREIGRTEAKADRLRRRIMALSAEAHRLEEAQAILAHFNDSEVAS